MLCGNSTNLYSKYLSKNHVDLRNIFKVGDSFSVTHSIEDKHSYKPASTKKHTVLSTHNMIYMAEDLCSDNLEEKLPPKHTSVGYYVDFTHGEPVPTGNKIKINAKVTDIDKKKITFKTEVYDKDKLISSGVHKRAVIQFD